MLLDEFNKWRERLEMDMDNVLETDVADTLTEHVLESVQENVYDAYDPKEYIRRKQNGGLLDRANYHATAFDNVLALTNDTRDNHYSREEDRDIVDVVESGNGYDFFSPGPRPFMETALQKGITDGSLEESLYLGMKKRGY